MRQPKLFDTRPFRTKAEMLAYIRAKIEIGAIRRRARKLSRKRRTPPIRPAQLSFF